MKRRLILTGMLIAYVGPIRSSALEPEPNWTNRYREIKQQLLHDLQPPAAGQTLTIVRRIGGEYTGKITSISSNSVVMGGSQYEARQLTDETCEKLFSEWNATKLAHQQVTRERAVFRERQAAERRKTDETAQLLAKAEEQKRLEDARRATNVTSRTQSREDTPLISSGVQPSRMEEYTLPDGTKGFRLSNEHERDPLENDARYAAAFKEADAKTMKELEKLGVKHSLGYCHAFWRTKKDILRRDYGIDWKTPAEINPYTRFD